MGIHAKGLLRIPVLVETDVGHLSCSFCHVRSVFLDASRRSAVMGRKFIQDRHGVTALEFAIVGPVFLLLILGVLELGVELTTQMLLDHSLDVAARQVQIGNITNSADFVTGVCGNFSVLVSKCSSSNLQVYATSGSSFSSLAAATISNGRLSSTTYSTGTAGSDVLIEVMYNRPYLVGMLASVTGKTTNSLLSSVAFQSEPF